MIKSGLLSFFAAMIFLTGSAAAQTKPSGYGDMWDWRGTAEVEVREPEYPKLDECKCIDINDADGTWTRCRKALIEKFPNSDTVLAVLSLQIGKQCVSGLFLINPRLGINIYLRAI